jgi:hypothetical protein
MAPAISDLGPFLHLGCHIGHFCSKKPGQTLSEMHYLNGDRPVLFNFDACEILFSQNLLYKIPKYFFMFASFVSGEFFPDLHRAVGTYCC